MDLEIEYKKIVMSLACVAVCFETVCITKGKGKKGKEYIL